MDTVQLQMIFDKLDKIAAKLGSAADSLWPLLLRQQYVDAYCSLFLFSISLLIFIILTIFVAKHWSPKNGYCIYDKDHEPFWAITLVTFGATVIGLGVFFINEFPDIFNPEYWALKDLVRMIK